MLALGLKVGGRRGEETGERRGEMGRVEEGNRGEEKEDGRGVGVKGQDGWVRGGFLWMGVGGVHDPAQFDNRFGGVNCVISLILRCKFESFTLPRPITPTTPVVTSKNTNMTTLCPINECQYGHSQGGIEFYSTLVTPYKIFFFQYLKCVIICILKVNFKFCEP